jgi:hypothetical protein
MGKVSAIPENLYLYSDQCSRAAGELQSWIRSALTPAIRAYENGGGTCFAASAIDGDAARQAAAAFRTDREVRTVAQAFEQAGSATARPGRQQQYVAAPDALEAAFRKLELSTAHQGQMDAGAALARRMTQEAAHDEVDALAGITGELAKHAGDPYFCAGFYNALTTHQIQQLLNRDSNVRALVSAYAGGMMSESATRNLVRALSWIQGADGWAPHDHITWGEQTAVLEALAGNQKAAVNFAATLDAHQMRKLFFGEAAKNPALRASLLKVLTVAMWNTADPRSAKALMSRVSEGLFSDSEPDPAPQLTPDIVAQALEPLAQFYSAGVARDVGPPPPGSDVQAVKEWAETLGKTIGADLTPLMNALENEDLDPAEGYKSIVQGAYLNVAFMPLGALAPEGLVGALVFNAAVGGLQSVVGSDYDPVKSRVLDREWRPGEKVPLAVLNDRIAGFAQFVALGQLLNQRPVYTKNSSVPLKLSGDPQADARLLTAITRNSSGYYFDPPGPGRGNSPSTLADVLGRFSGGGSEVDQVFHGVHG